MLQKIKKAISNFFEKLAKKNESAYGKGITLDCCQLNRPGSAGKK